MKNFLITQGCTGTYSFGKRINGSKDECPWFDFDYMRKK